MQVGAPHSPREARRLRRSGLRLCLLLPSSSSGRGREGRFARTVRLGRRRLLGLGSGSASCLADRSTNSP
eukprot:14233772-Alexandrium_andersonii.AAC.1